jgi:hypothetical protein
MGPISVGSFIEGILCGTMSGKVDTGFPSGIATKER